MTKRTKNKTIKRVVKAIKQVKRIKKRSRKTKKTNNSIGMRVARTVGRYAGNMVGMGNEGSQLAEAGINRLFGSGAYFQAGKGGINLAPSFVPLDRVFRISHREYIRDVNTSTLFSSLNFALNPGVQATFPWLSNLAPCFEKYKFKQLEFHLVSTSATAVSSTNTALGTWGAVTMSDPLDPLLTTKQQAENYQGCESSVPSCSIAHYVECKNKDNSYNWFFTRTGAVTGDLKTYDQGRFTYFSQGAQAASVAGELWVSYTVDFMIPRLPDGGIVAYSDYSIAILPTAANPLGSSPIYNPDNNIGSVRTPTTITLPAAAPQGLYMLHLRWRSTSAFTVPSVSYILSGSLAQNDCLILINGTSFETLTPVAGTLAATRMTSQLLFRKISQEAGLISVTAALGVTGDDVEYILTLINPNLGIVDDIPPMLSNDEYIQLKKLIANSRKKLVLDDSQSICSSEPTDSFEAMPRQTAKTTKQLRLYKPDL